MPWTLRAAQDGLARRGHTSYIAAARAELPARREEVEHAKEEGIEFCLLTTPLSIKGDDKFSVCAMNCQKMELGEPDASGRRRPIPVEGSAI